MKHKTGKRAPVPAGLAWGALASAVTTVLGAGMIAKLAGGEILEEGKLDYAAMVLVILASWTGSLVSYGAVGRGRLPICLASGAVYFGLLIILTAVCFGGRYSGVAPTALLIFCGSMLGVFRGLREKRGGKRPKIKISNG